VISKILCYISTVLLNPHIHTHRDTCLCTQTHIPLYKPSYILFFTARNILYNFLGRETFMLVISYDSFFLDIINVVWNGSFFRQSKFNIFIQFWGFMSTYHYVITTIWMYGHFYHPKNPLVPLSTQFLPFLQLLASTDLFSVPVVLPFSEWQHVVFWVWLLGLTCTLVTYPSCYVSFLFTSEQYCIGLAGHSLMKTEIQ
jgi:hypothetical protein